MASPVSLRLSDEKWRFYSEQAQAERIGLSTYLKRRLELGDQLIEQLSAIRRELENHRAEQTGQEQNGQSPPAPLPDGMMIEILLLLRSVVGEAKINLVHGELKRQQLPIWRGEK
jgi:hypothetical protein